MPLFARLAWGRGKFRPGAFYTGRFSVPIEIAALVYLCFGIVLSMFPSGGPDPSPESMNYTVVINTAVWGGCTLYYFVSARRWFTGPKTTLGEIETLTGELPEAQRQELVNEGVAVESSSPSDMPTKE